MTELSQYLASVARRPFAYGVLDCCTFMADWLVSLGLPDPMQDRRGTYSTEREYRTAMQTEGGILQSCETRFAAIGLREVSEPTPGDVCLVKAPFRIRGGGVLWGATGAIATSPKMRAVVTRDAGVVIAGPAIVRAWSVANG